MAVLLLGLASGLAVLLDGAVKIETDPAGRVGISTAISAAGTPLTLRGRSRGPIASG